MKKAHTTKKQHFEITAVAVENAMIEVDGEMVPLKEIFKIDFHQTVFGGIRVTMTKDGQK